MILLFSSYDTIILGIAVYKISLATIEELLSRKK
jgi:hypothetical protein